MSRAVRGAEAGLAQGRRDLRHPAPGPRARLHALVQPEPRAGSGGGQDQGGAGQGARLFHHKGMGFMNGTPRVWFGSLLDALVI